MWYSPIESYYLRENFVFRLENSLLRKNNEIKELFEVRNIIGIKEKPGDLV